MKEARKSQFGRLLLGAMVAGTFVIVYFGVRGISVRRRHAAALAEVHTRNLAQAVDQSLASMLKRIDHALVTVTAETERSIALGGLDRPALERFVKIQERLVPEAVAIRITDAEGTVIVNNPIGDRAARLRDRPFWDHLRDSPDAAVFVTRPVLGWFTKQYVVLSARRYNMPDGRFGGVVVLPVYVKGLQDALAGFDLGAGGRLTLRDEEGGFVTRVPNEVDGRTLEVGSQEAAGDLRAVLESPGWRQTGFASAASDPSRRTLTVRKIKGAPLIVVASLAEEDYLAEWRSGRSRSILQLAVAVLALWTLGALLWRQWRNGDRAAAALAASELKFRSLAESSPDHIMQCDAEGRLLYMNAAGLEAAGGSGSNAVGGLLRTGAFPPALVELWQQGLERVIRSGEPASVAFEWERSGAKAHLDMRLTPDLDSQGKVTAVLGVTRDITGLKQMEILLSKVTAMVPGVVYQYRLYPDNRSCFPYASAGMWDIYEVTPEEVREDATPVFGRIHPEDLAATAEAIFESARTLDLFHWEFRVVLPQQGLRWRMCDARPERTPDGGTLWYGIITDITERKQAEEVLRRSEEKFATIFHASPDAIAITGREDGTYFMVNEGFSRLMEVPVSEAVGRTSLDLGVWADPEDRARWVAALQPEGRVDNLEIVFRKPRGGEVITLVSTRTISLEGRPALLSIIRDITERRQLELALQETAEDYRLIFNRSLDGILNTSPDGRILDANPAACRMLGRTVEEIRSLGRNGILDTADPRLPAALEEREKTGRWAGELTFLRSDGSRFPCEISTVLYLDKRGVQKTSIILRDISPRREAEEIQQKLQVQLQHAQKMESLGSLAGGVAHDMNNVLGAILGVASARLLDQPAESATGRAFETISQAAIRGGKMVKSLLGFARQSPAEERDLDINAILGEEIELLRHTTPATVRILPDLAGDLKPIRGDANALTHAFMNLCVNAVDAMPDGGTLTLRTRNVDEEWIEVEVADTGSGMSPEVLEKAMDPFFTTKAVGKGTGLGLAMVYGAVSAHQGQIEIQSQVGQGTRVRLRFPVLDRSAPEPVPAIEGPSEAASLSLKVLLVDDDELIQTAVRMLLEVLGHQVATAASGEDALTMLAAGHVADLVILDMNMPGLGGSGTLPRLRALNPAIPVLLATGRADQAALDLVANHPLVTLLPKPFSAAELQAAIGPFR